MKSGSKTSGRPLEPERYQLAGTAMSSERGTVGSGVKSIPLPAGRASRSAAYMERAIETISGIITTSYAQWELSSRKGLLQGLDSRVKVPCIVLLLIVISVKRDFGSEALIAALVFSLAFASRLDLAPFYRRVLLAGFLFGAVVSLPSALNLFREGQVVVPLFRIQGSYGIGSYRIPGLVGFTKEGLEGVLMLTARVVNSVAATFLLLYTSPFPEIIRALKVFRVPDTLLMLISLTYKYIFILAKTVEEMHLAKKSRLAAGVGSSEMRSWVAGRIAFMFRKSQHQFEEVVRAMQARGFSGELKFHSRRNPGWADLLAGSLFFSVCIVLLIW